MARSEEVERRLLAWGRYTIKMRFGSPGYARASMQERVDDDRWDAPLPAYSDPEAEETGREVDKLPQEIRQAVHAVYLSDESMAAVARRVRLSRAELYSRIDQAHLTLDRSFRDIDAARRLERERVEALQRSAAKGSFRE